MIVDDYGHHPVEIKATLAAACSGWNRRLVAVFQPHRYSRTEALFDDYVTAFYQADHLAVMDIYAAGEKPIAGISAEQLADGISGHGHKSCCYTGDIEATVEHLQAVLLRAARHRGSAFVEIYQNCNIFNDLAFEHLTDRAVRSERLLYLQHGKPLTFGNDGEKAIVSAGRGAAARLAVADRADVSDTDIVVHDEGIDNDAYAYALGTIDYPEFPVPVGVFRAIEGPTFEDLVADQITEAQRRKGPGDLEALMHSGEVWTVE
jgi:hypothetical protein